MIRRFLLAAAALTVASTVASAQTACPAGGCTGTAKFTVPSILRLIAPDLDNNNNTTFAAVNASDFDAAGTTSIPKASVTNPTFDVVANGAWQVTVTAGAWDATSPTGKPVTDVHVKNSGNTYVAVSGANVQIATGSAGRNTVTPSYEVIVNLTDAPGSYTMPLTYTIATN